MRSLLLIFFVFVSSISFAQITQVIRGTVKDADTKITLPGANVVILGDSNKVAFGTTADINGNFKLEDVPVGKQTVCVSFMGYLEQCRDVEVTSGKEVVLTLLIEESCEQLEEVVIEGSKKGEVRNEMAMVSARSFSVEESNRYAGSRMDPARMASNFAGVQGADDSRNDIIVRGNSPTGVVWRVEGVDIPNPSHFAVSGSTGGPVAILNNKMLSNSDFFTGAFPAEYGNSISAVFDLKLRNGNNQRHEFTGQFGLLGTEFLAEGPLNREKGSSYLLMGRYSTLSIFQLIGVKIGTDAVPQYWDGAFKFNFPQKNGGNIALWGLGGRSTIDIVISEQVAPPEDQELYGESDRDQYFQTGMATGGLVYTKPFNKDFFMKLTVAGGFEQQTAQHDYVERFVNADNQYQIDSIFPLMRYRYDNFRNMNALHFTYKINRKHLLKYGVNADLYLINNQDSVLNFEFTDWVSRWDFQDQAMLVRPFFQWRWKFNDDWTVNAGVQSSYFSLSNSISPVEPRAGIRWSFAPRHSISYGIGLHSQMQPLYLYSYHLEGQDGEKIYHLRDMDFTKSWHNVISWDYAITTNMRMKLETYHQYLFNIPVELQPSSYAMVNMGSGFQRFFPDSVQNTGTGFNYGIELTLEKFFNDSYFFMFTGSLFESKYRGSDGILRDTDYNTNYAANILGGKEFKAGERGVISTGIKATFAGGRRYGYVDEEESLYRKELVFKDSLYNTRQFRPYFRFDVKVNYRINAPKMTHEIGVDLVNVFGIQNILGLTYAEPPEPGLQPYTEQLQLGFLPIFYYKIDFRPQRRK